MPAADARVATESAEAVTARLVDFSPAVLEPSSRLSASVSARNTAATTIDEVVLELALTEQPLADRSALATFLDDPRSFPTRVAVQEPESATDPGDASDSDDEASPEPAGMSIAPGSTRTLTVGASPAELGMPSGQWGVYGAVLTLRTADGAIAVDALPITWQGAPVPELGLSVIAQAEGDEDRVAALLGASNVPGVTSAFDPTVVTNAMAFDAGLVGRETWRLASGSPDLTSLAHAGDTTLLDFSLALHPRTNLASIGNAPWLAVPAALDASSIAAAADHGAGAALALPDAAGFAELAAAAGATVADANDTRILVPDADLSAAVAQYRPGTAAAPARVIAESALLAEEAAGAPVLVALGEGWQPSSGEPSGSLEALMMAPWIDPVPLSELLDADATSVELPTTLAAESDLPAADVEALTDQLDDLSRLASAATSPDSALADWGSRLLAATAVELRANPGVRSAIVTGVLSDAQDTMGSLRIAESSDLNLLAETGEIPITVVNGLEHDVSVAVDLTSFSPNLQVLETPTITVAAGEEHAALVPVEAVSSANVRVAVVLRGAEGAAVSDSQSFAVRVRADWGNAATAVFSVLLVLLLAAGLIRTARRGRKDTRAKPAPAPPLAPDGDNENVGLASPGPAGEDSEPPGDSEQPSDPEHPQPAGGATRD